MSDQSSKKEQRMARQPEIKVAQLLRLVQRDYLDNGRKSKANVDYQIERHLGPHFGERSAERLRGTDIEAYKDMRLAQNAKRSTINLELATLRRAGTLGRQRELITKYPRIVLFPVGNSNRRTGFFEHDDFLKMLSACKPYQKQMLRFAYVSGMREGELFKLRWAENYDEAGNAIRIFTSKSGKGRTIPLIGDCAAVIAEQKERRMANCPYIFHFQGRQPNRNTFNHHWRQACKVAGVNRHFHDLRRTAVRNLTRAGVHRTIAKAITGHETDHVFERYDIVDSRDLSDALTRVGDYIKQRDNTNLSSPKIDANMSLAPNGGKSPVMAERAGFEPASLSPDFTISSRELAQKRLKYKVQIGLLRKQYAVMSVLLGKLLILINRKELKND